ncbi:hypothetical protein JMY07_10715 [Burkholderia thailandensis]|nr:hypothetical protein JMY07_10715 [Burkholderia thailandensis]
MSSTFGSASRSSIGPKPAVPCQRLRDRAHLVLVERNAAQPHKAVDLEIDELVDRLPRPAPELRAQLLDARQQMLVRGVLDVVKLLRLRERRRPVGKLNVVPSLTTAWRWVE